MIGRRHWLSTLTSVLFTLVGAASPVLAEPAATTGEDASSEAAPSEAEQALEALCTLIRQQPGTVTEGQVVEAIEKAAELGHPLAAERALRHYLATNANPTTAVMRAAIDSARRVGDYNEAMVRCKAYLEAARPGDQASQVAALLYWMQIDLLDLPGDAYRAMSSPTDKLCTGSDARKFDAWYLDQARRSEDYANVARRLVEIYEAGLPAARTQSLCASYVDWVLKEIGDPEEEMFPAVAHVSRLAEVIEDTERIEHRMALYAANLKFLAEIGELEPTERASRFAPVLKAAQAYVAKFRDANALHDVMSLWGGKGDRNYSFREEQQGERKHQFFVDSFGTLPLEEQRSLLDMHSIDRCASREQWTDLAIKHPRAFHNEPVAFLVSSPEECKRLAPATEGVQREDAAMIRTMAAGDEFGDWLDHLATQEAWREEMADRLHYIIAFGRGPYLKGRFQRWKESEKVELPSGWYEQAMARFGAEHVAKTPLALDRSLVAEYLKCVRQTDPGDVDAAVESLAWVPYTSEERQRLHEEVRKDVVGWSGGVRKDREDAAKEVAERTEDLKKAEEELGKRKAEDESDDRQKRIDEAQQRLDEAEAELKAAVDRLASATASLERVDRVGAAIEKLKKRKTGDPGRAPNALCRHLAELYLADRADDAKGYLAAARRLYPLVKDYRKTKIPAGEKVYRELLAPREGFDLFDFHVEVLADRLDDFDAASLADEEAMEKLTEQMMQAADGWDLFRIPTADKERALKLHNIFADALGTQIDRGKFSPWLWEAVRGTSRGTGWELKPDDNANRVPELVEKMIERDVLANHPWRDQGSFATTTYMGLVRENGESLAEKYPLATHFQEMMLRESAREGYADTAYFQLDGEDPERKIGNLAAELVVKAGALPVDGRDPQPCTLEEFREMQSLAMRADPAKRDAMLSKLESFYGKTRFDPFAMGKVKIEVMADLSTSEARAEYFKRLKTYLERAVGAVFRAPLPDMSSLSSLDDEQPLSDGELDILLRIFSPRCALSEVNVNDNHADRVTDLLLAELPRAGRHSDLFTFIPHLWRVATFDRGLRDRLVERAVEFQQQGRYDLAAALSGVALDMFESYIGDSDQNRLRIARAQSMLKLGGGARVDPGDPHYAILAAQADYLRGTLERAWQGYLENRELTLTAVEQLDPSFVVWLIRRNTTLAEFDAAEELAREALQQMESRPEQFSQQARANLLLAYAGIALARPEYPRARALFDRIATAKEFAGTRAQVMAELHVAEVDRLTKNFAAAFDRLERLAKRQDRFAQREAHFHLAKVLFDQEQYTDALQEVETVFNYDPTHAEARILEGKVNLRIKRLEQASRINVGFLADQQFITPGSPLRVGLRDQSLAVAGNTRAIEMRAWTDSGDEEHFTLVPFADSRTQFEGQVPTELAPVVKDDHTLQLLGNDRVYYDFSERFKETHNVESEVDHHLVVLSNADLYASSGEILTKDEMEQRAMERAIRQQLDLEQREEQDVPLGDIRPDDQVKPGNPINVRVIDPDQSVTEEADQLSVTLSTTSGDQVTFDLRETGTHTGIFDGAVPTASALATAMASDSDQGSRPLHAISAGDHPAWIAARDNQRPKTFGIDLNANERLSTMTIDAGISGRRLKQFLVQTSVDGRRFRTVGSWPSDDAVWGGSPRLERLPHDEALSLSAPDMQRLLAASPPSRVAVEQPEQLGATLKSDRPEIVHIAAAFHCPTRRTITLQLRPNTEKGEARYTLLVDGREAEVLEPAEGAEAAEPTIEFRDVLAQGVHQIDIYVAVGDDTTTGFQLLRDTEEPPYLEPCPMEMFDPEQHPVVAKRFAELKTEVTAAEGDGSFEVTFGPAVRARVVRLLLADFEGDAPAIEKIHLTARDGRKLLPTEVDLLSLKTNQVLEIVPGDRVSVSYRDPRYISERDRVREAFLSATYANGSITAALLTGYTTSNDGLRQPQYVGLRRFKPGDTIMVVVNDTDADVSGQLDTVSFTMRTGDGEPVELEALETESHSGVFLGKIFAVQREPQRKSEIQVAEGEDLVLSYYDRENTDPGIPWERSVTIASVVYMEPEFRVFDIESSRLSDEEIAQERQRGGDGREFVPASRSLAAVRPEAPTVAHGGAEADRATGDEPAEPARAVLGAPIVCELLWPTIVQTTASTAEIYVQTSTGREQYGKQAEEPFDINVPGTIRLSTSPSSGGGGAAPAGYRGYVVVGDPDAMDPMDDGRFMFTVPLRLGSTPTTSFATEEVRETATKEELEQLVVRGGDDVFIGFRYVDDQDQTRWITRRVKLGSDAFFHVMDRSYSELLSGLYVGQTAYARVIDPAKDVSGARDRVTAVVTNASDEEHPVELVETFEHSGVFKGPVKFRYADGETGNAPIGTVGVTYGEQVAAVYRPGEGAEPLIESLDIFKGSDGDVQPFTKRFEDPLTAVRTRLTIAEAYFELAKKHRQLGQDALVEEEIATGKRLLEEALRDYPDTEARAQVDYLLANLSLEFAEEADDEAARREYFNEALSRFSSIVSNYRDSTYAPKAQFKKALTLEQMGEIDRASEEYVKLSYRWPESPLIAETIARLGQYFFRNGVTLLKKSDTLKQQAIAQAEAAEQAEDPGQAEERRAASADKLLEAEKARRESLESFTTAGKVFSRLAVRFPTHRLADKSTALSGQCLMRAKLYDDAVAAFRKVIDNEKADKELRAESLYWAADSFMRKVDAGDGDKEANLKEAYLLFKNLALYYPESKWARYARGRLAGDDLVAFDAVEERE